MISIASVQEYEVAIKELELLMDKDPAGGTPDGDRLNYLAIEVENYELRHTLKLIGEADERGIKMWQEATGHTNIWPDRGKMIFWLLERLDALQGQGRSM